MKLLERVREAIGAALIWAGLKVLGVHRIDVVDEDEEDEIHIPANWEDRPVILSGQAKAMLLEGDHREVREVEKPRPLPGSAAARIAEAKARLMGGDT